MSATKQVNFSTGSIGYPVLGINVYDVGTSGGGLKGYMNPSTYSSDRTNQRFTIPRLQLRQEWNTTYPSQLHYAHLKSSCTPFRRVTNSGDLLSRKYYSCGGPCQTFQSRPNVYGLSRLFGHIANDCDNTGIPPASCNVKWVYDSSDYVTFKKQQAMARNYNDLSSGGNKYNGDQVAFKAIRRF